MCDGALFRTPYLLSVLSNCECQKWTWGNTETTKYYWMICLRTVATDPGTCDCSKRRNSYIFRKADPSRHTYGAFPRACSGQSQEDPIGARKRQIAEGRSLGSSYLQTRNSLSTFIPQTVWSHSRHIITVPTRKEGWGQTNPYLADRPLPCASGFFFNNLILFILYEYMPYLIYDTSYWPSLLPALLTSSHNPSNVQCLQNKTTEPHTLLALI